MNMNRKIVLIGCLFLLLGTVQINFWHTSGATISEAEPNDEFLTAMVVTSGNTYNGSIGSGDGYDFFKILLNKGTDKLEARLVLSQGNTEVSLYDPNKLELAKLDSSTLGQTTLILTTVATITDYYYISLRDMGPADYNLTINVTTVSYTTDNDNDWANATTISSFPYTNPESLDNLTDPTDLYKLSLSTVSGVRTDVLIIFLDVPSTGDFDIEVYKYMETDLKRSASTPVMDYDENLTYSPYETGDYCIRLKSANGIGSYTLKVFKETGWYDNDNTYPNAKALEKIDAHKYTASGNVSAAGIDTYDRYKIPVSPEQVINATLFSKNYPYDPKIALPLIYVSLHRSAQLDYFLIAESLGAPYGYANGTVEEDGSPYYIEVEAKEPQGGVGSYIIDLTMNTPPKFVGTIQNITMLADTEYWLDLNKIFNDSDGDSLSFFVKQTDNISVEIAQNGSAKIKPAAGWVGSDNLTFIAKDTFGMAVEWKVDIIVRMGNRAPVVKEDAQLEVELKMNTPASLYFWQYFYDPDGDKLTYGIKDNGSIEIIGSINQEKGEVTIRPFNDWTGTQVMNLSATDGVAFAYVDVTFNVVPPGNRAPKWSEIETINLTEDPEPKDYFVLDLKKYCTDPDGDKITYTVKNNGSVDIFIDNATEKAKFIPKPNYYGMIPNAKFIAKDEHGVSSESETFTITVKNVNDAPLIETNSPKENKINITETDVVSFSVKVSDIDDERADLRLNWYMDGVKVGDGESYTYRSDYKSSGKHEIIFNVSDKEGLYSSFTWVVFVENKNRAPKISSVEPTNNSIHREGVKIKFAVNATDEDNDQITYVWLDGDKEISKEQKFTKALSKGKHKITVKVSDETNTTTSTIYITVKEKPPSICGASIFAIVTLLGFVVLVSGSEKRK
ncbi:MAG: tandem-95 repeat protein [Candidatus Thermoplasmatota archaeon]